MLAPSRPPSLALSHTHARTHARTPHALCPLRGFIAALLLLFMGPEPAFWCPVAPLLGTPVAPLQGTPAPQHRNAAPLHRRTAAPPHLLLHRCFVAVIERLLPRDFFGDALLGLLVEHRTFSELVDQPSLQP